MKHNTEPYLLNPTHKISVNLIGLGGTGSQVLTGLYRLNEALLGIGHPGIHVCAWDADIVTEANIGRQLFSPADIGFNKAVVLITRLNTFAGYCWEAKPVMFNKANAEAYHANITISCVDTVAARRTINKSFWRNLKQKNEPDQIEYYWLDFGNMHKTGQCVLGTINCKEPINRLPTIFDLIPDLKKQKDKNNEPSCSLAQALGKQDLYINSTLAQFGLNLIWKLFREGGLKYHGVYLNLDSMSVNPIKVVSKK